ncbi:hypothetical protein MUP77_05220 [Candidatus Bathyarchaeota archaeon]|nr:hypothetical protein [Candidatus Bathyarchaeota archaeon]
MQRQDRTSNKDTIIRAVATGFFFILVGAIFISTPNLTSELTAFFKDFISVKAPNTENVFLPVPASLRAHLNVYMAVENFSIVWGTFQIFLLPIRLIFHSTTHRKSENVSDIVLWLGLSYLISFFLNSQVTLTGWFLFWTMTITLLGVSLIARAITSALLTR